MRMKACPTCHKRLNKSLFNKNTTKHDGLQSCCKTCFKKTYKAWMAKNPDRAKFLRREATLKNKYAITLEEWDTLYDTQKGMCLMCGIKYPKEDSGGNRILKVEHNHKNGRIRGLACGKCNSGLGYFKENSQRLIGAWVYIKWHEFLERQKKTSNPISSQKP